MSTSGMQMQLLNCIDIIFINYVHTSQHSIHDTDSQPCYCQRLGQCIMQTQMWHNVDCKYLAMQNTTAYLPSDWFSVSLKH